MVRPGRILSAKNKYPLSNPSGSMLDQAAANWNTSLGAACFLACALDTLHTDRASKMSFGRRLGELEYKLETEVR